MKQEDAAQSSARSPFYFGTWRQSGHYLWRATGPGKWAGERWPWGGTNPLPWDQIDGKLHPHPEVEGRAFLHHKGGWTALAFADRSVDHRPGSNSIFFFPGSLTFEEALAAAREWFPHVMRRFTFDIELVGEVRDVV